MGVLWCSPCPRVPMTTPQWFKSWGTGMHLQEFSLGWHVPPSPGGSGSASSRTGATHYTFQIQDNYLSLVSFSKILHWGKLMLQKIFMDQLYWLEKISSFTTLGIVDVICLGLISGYGVPLTGAEQQGFIIFISCAEGAWCSSLRQSLRREWCFALDSFFPSSVFKMPRWGWRSGSTNTSFCPSGVLEGEVLPLRKLIWPLVQWQAVGPDQQVLGRRKSLLLFKRPIICSCT